MLYDIFISYARENQNEAAELHADLTGLGFAVWFDQLQSKERGPFEQIEDAISRSSFVVLIWSSATRQAEFVRKEIQFAEELGKQVIPIKLDSAPFSSGVRLILTGTSTLDARRTTPVEALAPLLSRIAPTGAAPAPVFTFLNMKGGVGKTTLTANVGLAFNQYSAFNKSVLLIDLDPQSNLSTMLVDQSRLSDAIEFDRSIISCFEHSRASGRNESPSGHLLDIDSSGDIPLPYRLAYNLVNPLVGKRFDIILGQFELFKFSLSGNAGAIPACKERFGRFIEMARQQYEVVCIDAAPSNSFLTECALTFCTDIVAPVTPDKYALSGVKSVQRIVSEGYQITPAPPLHVLRNFMSSQPSLAETTILDAYGDHDLGVRIRESRYFQVRNPDPGTRIRNALPDVGALRGGQGAKAILRPICEQLLKRYAEREQRR